MTSTRSVADRRDRASSSNKSRACESAEGELTAVREACCLEGAVFSRIPNWRGRCMILFQFQLEDSPFVDVPFETVFEVGSEVLVCWPESHLWKSLSLR